MHIKKALVTFLGIRNPRSFAEQSLGPRNVTALDVLQSGGGGNMMNFLQALDSLKMENHEVAYIYSDFRAVYNPDEHHSKVQFLEHVTESLMAKISTLIIPSFTYTTEGFFNPSSTTTKLGALNSYIQRLEGSYTSNHPMFSFSGIGPAAERVLANIGSEAFGYQSVFERLSRERCVFIHLGRPPQLGNTLVHHVESRFHAPYREEVSFPTKVILGTTTSNVPYTAYLRRIEDLKNGRYETSFAKAAESLIKQGVYKRLHFKSEYDCIWSADFNKVQTALSRLYEQDETIFI